MYRISVPCAQKDPRFLFKKRRGQPGEFWSLISTMRVVHYPRTVWKNSHAEHKVTGKTYSLKRKTTIQVHRQGFGLGGGQFGPYRIESHG